jgi:peptidylprolyl isomerase
MLRTRVALAVARGKTHKMKAKLLIAAAALLGAPAIAQTAQTAAPSPGEIVAASPAGEWVAIQPIDLLVMDLTPDRAGQARRVVIQLIPAPFSQPWTANIRALAKARWWDGLAIVRAQDNYVVQWGDPNAEEAEEARPLPTGITATTEADYAIEDLLAIPDARGRPRLNYTLGAMMMRNAMIAAKGSTRFPEMEQALMSGAVPPLDIKMPDVGDTYAPMTSLVMGWPIAGGRHGSDRVAEGFWPVHCYGTVGVGRGMPPDAGSGAELYTVIGHAPRHLDRNIAVVGRVIEGIEHLSTLPRGTEALGFYKTREERTPINSIRLGAEVPGLPAYQYLSTEGETFARYAEARANRRDPFFIVPAGGADVCNIPVPVRRAPAP